MSAITPQTELRLIKCPIESDNRNQITFTNTTAQYNYFNSLPHLEVDNFTYQRKDSVIRYPAHIDSILTYNYVMYKNENYSNKWFYAFITKMEYVNDNMTLITIHTDVYQTWMFDMVWKRSFVEREHVNDDTIGKHTIPEGLETGEYVCTKMDTTNTFDELCIVTASTVGPSDLENYDMNIYNKIPSPVVYCRWDLNNTATGLNGLKSFINSLNNHSKIDAMQYMFFAPTWLCNRASGTVYIEESNNYNSYVLELNSINSLNGYTPTNKKLLCYPYCYFGMSNSVGQFNILKQELWEKYQGAYNVLVDGVLSAGCSIKAIPYRYKGIYENYDEGITLGKFPQLSWTNDLYTNWQTQNGINIGGIRLNATETGYLKAGAQLAVGTALASSGDIVGGGSLVAGGVNSVFNTMQEQYQHSLQPNGVEGSLNAGDITTIAGGNKLFVYTYTIKQEYAKIIDNFFNLYGYKVNDLKIPNITGRTNWNYVKTNGANIEGDIPEDHLNEIKSLFNNGITLWHNSSTYLDYSQSNSIVS